MKLFPGIFILIFLTIFSKEITAQTQDVRFTLVTGGNGISFGKINAFLRDKYGFIWLSDQSNGCIIRYDGNQLVRYKNMPRNPNSLGGVYPECLASDTSDIIWIGFYGTGLDRFDPHTNTFTHFRHNQTDPQSLSDDFVSAVRVDHLGNVWVGTNNGLDLLDQKTGKFKHFRSRPDDSASLSYNVVRVIYEDKAGELWIGTGFPWTDNNTGGLNHFHRNNGTFTRYLNDPKNTSTLIDNKVRAIFEDSRGNFWIGTRGDGLHTMDRRTGLFTRFTNNPSNPGQLSRPPIKNSQDHITFITEDIAHQLWIGTLSNGVIRYDPDTKKIVHYTNYSANPRNRNDTSSWSAFAAPEGIVWLSTQDANLYKIDLYNSIVPHFGDSESDAAHTFCEESASVLWVGTWAGLFRKNLKDGTTQHFVHDPKNPNSLSSNKINAIIKDKQGDLLIGTSGGGLDRYNPQSNIFSHYFNNENDNRNDITVLWEDNDSTIWVGTTGAGLNHFDPRTGKNIQYVFNNTDSTNIYNVDVSTIAEDSIYLWVGESSFRGINRMDRRTKSSKAYLSGARIYCAYKDKNAVVWLGTEGGLYRYDKESDTFLTGAEINDALNLPNAFSIIEDNENNLWIVSTPGIYKLNPRRDHAILFGPEHGIPQGNNFYSGFKMKDGKLYFGNTDGYFAFYPGNMDVHSSLTQLYLTNFWLNNVEVRPGENSLLPPSIYETNEIRLRHDQNIFSFGFSIIDFREPNVRVYYKLENYDPDWRIIGTTNRAEYYKVAPGKYHLLIKTINSSNGEWMAKSIEIIISPPWWKTWWAYCTYALLLIGSALMIHRFQRNRLLKKERERSRINELKQAKEIEKAYQELKVTQSQLIQSEKMASLGELTAGIAHEIQNPLNFINNFSEVNNELIDEMQQELKSGNNSEAVTISNSIKENQEKINHHGKRADAIVKGMLLHSRNSSGQKEPTDINAIADEYLRLSYHGLRAKENNFNATIQTEFDPTIGNIDIIPQDIGRVLMNLYNNAFYTVSEKRKQSSENYQPTVVVTTRKIGEKVEIRVKDNGNGIPQKLGDKIFQPFFTTKPTGQGTGLGLSLSYDIIKAHGGELKVESKEGEGSVFVIEMPVK